MSPSPSAAWRNEMAAIVPDPEWHPETMGEAQARQLRDELDRLRAELAAMCENHQAAVAHYRKRDAELADHKERYPYGEVDLDMAIEAETKDLRAELATKDARIAELENAADEDAGTVFALRADNEALRNELAETKAALEQQTAVVEGQMRYYNAALEAAIDDKREAIKTAENALAGLSAALEAANARIAELEAGQICGACGHPWDGQGCAQKDNDYPFQTCYPVVNESPLLSRAERAEARIAELEAVLDCTDGTIQDLQSANALPWKARAERANARIEELNECWLNATGRETKWEAAWDIEKARAERADAKVKELEEYNKNAQESNSQQRLYEGELIDELNEWRTRYERAEAECEALRETLEQIESILVRGDKPVSYMLMKARAALNPSSAEREE